MKSPALVTMIALVASVALSGCTYVAKKPGGEWRYVNLMNKKSIAEIDLKSDGGLKVKGYTSDAAETIKAAAEGATKGAVEGLAK